MSYLGPETDPALDRIGERLGELGYSELVGEVAPLGLSSLAAVVVRMIGRVYGEARMIDDLAGLAKAWFRDNAEWIVGERIAASQIEKMVRAQLERVLYPKVG